MQEEIKVRRVKLQNEADVRRYAGWLIRHVEAGNVPEGRAKAINSLLRTIMKAVELGDMRELEQRIEALEAMTDGV